MTLFAVSRLSAGPSKYRLMLYTATGALHVTGDELLSSPKPQKMVYVFWSLTCQPCIDEMPELMRLASDSRTRFFYVNLLDQREEVGNFADRIGLEKSSVLMDERMTAAKSFGVLNADGQPVLPQIFVLDGTGQILLHTVGFTQANTKALKKKLNV